MVPDDDIWGNFEEDGSTQNKDLESEWEKRRTQFWNVCSTHVYRSTYLGVFSSKSFSLERDLRACQLAEWIQGRSRHWETEDSPGRL